MIRSGQPLNTYASRAPTALATLEAGFDDATAALALPEPYRRRLRTSNAMERLNEEVRRRERVIRIFPNRASAMRLLGQCSWSGTSSGPPVTATSTWPPTGSGGTRNK